MVHTLPAALMWLVSVCGVPHGWSQQQAAVGDARQAEASRLNQQASDLDAAGKYSEGVPLAEQAIALFESIPGSGDAALAEAVMTLGYLQFHGGNFAAAATSFERGLTLLQKAPAPDDLALADALGNLANARRGLGQLVESEELFGRCLAIQEKALGADHLDVGRTLISLGSLQDARGDSVRAESTLRRALQIFEANNAADTMEMAALLNNLGLLYQRSGALDKAEGPLQRSLAIRERLLPPSHPQIARAVANLAIVYQELGQLERAEALDRRAIQLYEASVGPSSLNLAPVLNNLGMIRLVRGDTTEAEPLYLRALRIRESVLGPRHADVAKTRESLAVFYQVVNRPEDALREMERSAAIVEQNLRVILTAGSEQQRLNYMSTAQENTDIALSLRRAALEGREDAAAFAASLVLRRKGRVLDALVSTNVRLSGQSNVDRDLLDQLTKARTELAALVLQPGGGAPGEREQRTHALESDIERLETALSASGRTAQSELRAVELADVQRQIPEDTALVEYVRYRPFDPHVGEMARRFGPSRYALFVLRSMGPVPMGGARRR